MIVSIASRWVPSSRQRPTNGRRTTGRRTSCLLSTTLENWSVATLEK
jgi:hypothetical protein